MLTGHYWTTGVASIFVVVLCVLVHYEGLRLLTDYVPMPRLHHRRRMIVLIMALLLMHVVEVWIFAFAYYGLLRYDGFGALHGAEPASLFDYVYYSASVYSTVGFGDIHPVGPIRTMTGVEGILGLTLITWSASYTFLEMLKSWRPND